MDESAPPIDAAGIKALAKSRLQHPFLKWYIPCWMVVNWRVFVYAFSTIPDPDAKIGRMSQALFSAEMAYGVLSFGAPLLSATLLPAAVEWLSLIGEAISYFLGRVIPTLRIKIEEWKEKDVRDARDRLEQVKGRVDPHGKLYRATLEQLEVERNKTSEVESQLSALTAKHEHLSARYRTLFQDTGEQIEAAEFSVQALRELLRLVASRFSPNHEVPLFIGTEHPKADVNRFNNSNTRLRQFRQDPANVPAS